MAGYIGTKAVLLSTTAASVTGNANIGGNLTVDTNTLFVDAASNNVGIGQNYGLTNSKLVVSGQSPGGDGAYATGRGSIVLNESGRNSINDTGGLEFKASVFGNGYGAKIISLDNGILVFGNRENSATYLERARIDMSGNLLVGTTSQIRASTNPSVQIESAGGEQLIIRHASAAAGNLWRFTADSNNTVYIINQNTTGVYIGNGGNSWISLSDERHKDIIEPITNAAAKLTSLRAVIGKYKTDEEGKRRSFLIAQDVQSVLPEAVHAEDPDRLGLSYTDTIPLLTAALQEALNEIAALKDRVAALETV